MRVPAEGPIRGKVAALLSSTELAINRGASDGIELGMQFAVLDPSVADITDPDTGESLGTLKREKVRVEIVKAEEKFSLARTYEKVRSNSSSLGGVAAFLQATAGSAASARTKTLEQRDAAWKQIDESRSYVKIGDPVEEIAQSAPEPESDELEEGSAT